MAVTVTGGESTVTTMVLGVVSGLVGGGTMEVLRYKVGSTMLIESVDELVVGALEVVTGGEVV